MKKSALLVAGLVAFDLGTMVVQGQAATSDYKFKEEASKNLESLSFVFMKLDFTFTATVCGDKGGKVVQHEGSQQCQIPVKKPEAGNK